MAHDTRLKLKPSLKVTKLANSLATVPFLPRFSDLMVRKLGTNRKSEIQGKIGNTKVSYEKLLTDYIMGL